MPTITRTSEGYIIVDEYQGHRSREAPALGPVVKLANAALRAEFDSRRRECLVIAVETCATCGQRHKVQRASPLPDQSPSPVAAFAATLLASANCITGLAVGETVAVDEDAVAYSTPVVEWGMSPMRRPAFGDDLRIRELRAAIGAKETP